MSSDIILIISLEIIVICQYSHRSHRIALLLLNLTAVFLRFRYFPRSANQSAKVNESNLVVGDFFAAKEKLVMNVAEREYK